MRSTTLRFATLGCFVATLSLAIPTASAESWEEDGSYTKDTWPLQITKRPLVLAPGMLELAGNTVRVNLSKDFVGDPISLAPSLSYGINKKLSVGITHERGICVAGDSCDKTYNDLAVGARYSIMGRGNFQLTGNGGVSLPSLSPDLTVGANVGMTARIQAGKFAIVTSPILYVGITERDTLKEAVRLPLAIQMQLNNQTAIAIESGIEGPLKDLGDFYAVPLALTGIFAISEKIDFGATARFANIGGKDSSADEREVIGHIALRL